MPFKQTWAVILAAGSGSRLRAAGLPVSKQFLEYRGVPLFWHSARTFARVSRVSGLVFAVPPEELKKVRKWIGELYAAGDLGLPYVVAPGGERRQDSVHNGLKAVPAQAEYVLIHDSARPFVSARVIVGVIEALDAGAQAALPMMAVTDTVKRVSAGTVVDTLSRGELMAAQTPQGFSRAVLLEAFARANAEGWEVTDDASLAERAGVAVAVVDGDAANVKITNPEDLRLLEHTRGAASPRVGFGYDVHRFAVSGEVSKQPARPMKLGGIPIPGAPEVLAHSDGDVLLHALTDALLGCLGGGDIGQRFPDSDPAYAGIESGVLISEVLREFAPAGLAIVHVDVTVIAEVPKVSPHRHVIRDNLADLLAMDPARVNVKATTEERLGFTGEKKGIKAVAVVTAIERGQTRS